MGHAMKMKAAILTEQNKPLVIDDVGLPEKLDFGQVLVQVKYSGICGSQIGEINGVKGVDYYLPHLLGHEGSGIVMDMGPGVINLKKGDHVVMHWKIGKGLPSFTPNYSWENKKLNAGYVTTFNELAIVSENRLTKIGKEVNLEVAALFGCAVTTGLGVINNNANVKIGESVVLFGSGGIGLNIIQGAAMVSANPIIAIDLYDEKLELARMLGATHIINSKKSDPKKAIKDILNNQNPDVVIDNTGNVNIIQLAYEMTSKSGRTILVGVPNFKEKVSINTLPLHFEKILTGSHGGETQPEKDILRYLKLYQNGKLKLDGLVTDRFNLNEINRAITLMNEGKVTGRCLIKVS
tara:strand:- start:808 stop:1860 length:1053 start_codon:yes stop_codon:yes gene_type:complete